MSKPHPDEEPFNEKLPEGVVLKEHSYDGIREYDQKLPRWWLMTLYSAMVFAGAYWFIKTPMIRGDDTKDIDRQLQAVATLRLQNSIDVTNNAGFWEMSSNSAFVDSGRATYMANCMPCHGDKLQGGIGFNLVDEVWVHGAQPASIYNTIENGVLDKGMQAWGNLLGQKKIAEVVAFILSQNDRATIEKAALTNP